MLQQVKEMGVVVYDCPCLAKDISKLFDVYWQIGGLNKTLPPSWPRNFSTLFNSQKPMKLKLNDSSSRAFVAVGFC